jgi:L-threonylcarbamoyladenylate synthase
MADPPSGMREDVPVLDRDADIPRAVEALRRGGLVAFPTETVYGLGADASNPTAVRRLYAVKGRPPEHPVIIHVAGGERLEDWARDVPHFATKLAEACWPGPLTLVLRRRPDRVSDEVTGGAETVAIRVPAQPLALTLLRSFAGGIAAPSANRFGRVSPTTAAHVRADLGDDVEVVLDGGPCAVGVESTIVDCSTDAPAILRLGGVSPERLERMLGEPVKLATGDDVRAPGTLASHYAPRAAVVVVREREIAARAVSLQAAGHRVGLLTPHSPTDVPPGVVVLQSPDSVADYARVLYARLREADDLGLDVLLTVPASDEGLGHAVNDRLQRAAARALP